MTFINKWSLAAVIQCLDIINRADGGPVNNLIILCENPIGECITEMFG